MTHISEKSEDLYALAGRCPFAALVQCSPDGTRFVLRNLGRGIVADETFRLADAGFTESGGLVAISKTGEVEMLAKAEIFVRAVEQAAGIFAVEQLQRIHSLEDPRAQA